MFTDRLSSAEGTQSTQRSFRLWTKWRAYCLQMEKLQRENVDLKSHVAKLDRKVKSLKEQRAQQDAKVEEMRVQQLGLTQTFSHLVSENNELKAELRSKGQTNQDASCSDSDL